MPVSVKSRRCSAEQRVILNKYMSQLCKMGYVKQRAYTSWQAAPRFVPKYWPSNFRATVDMRPVNCITMNDSWPMPNIESDLSDFKRSKCFASIEFCVGDRQCPLGACSYDACKIILPQRPFISTLVLHGFKNFSAYFHSTILPVFQDMPDAMKIRINDFIIHRKTEKQFISKLQNISSNCVKHNLVVSAQKFAFLVNFVIWCGRIIDSQGFEMDLNNIYAMQNMTTPTTAAKLCQFIHYCQWVAICIPNFQNMADSLMIELEKA